MAKQISWLLVSAPHTNFHLFPLGLAYISAVLKNAGHRVICLDLGATPLNEDAECIRQAVREHNPDVIGVSGLSRDFNRMRNSLRAAREVKADIVTVAGGGGISSDPKLFAQSLDVDFGVVGEGEETVLELTDAIIDRAIDPGGISGLVFRDAGGTYRQTIDRRGTKDLESLPIPDYDGFGLQKYLDLQKPGYTGFGGADSHRDDPRAFPIVFSRSCPFPCTFCYHAISKYRERSLDSVFAEIEHLRRNYNINMLGIYDDLFALKRERLKEFCERIKGTGLTWGCQIRVNIVDQELLQLMRDSGCISISYGFESMAPKVLDSMKKKIKAEEIEAAAHLTYDVGIDIQANFIFGDFAEDYDTINETMTWWYNNHHYNVSLSALEVYPGAEIYHRAIREDIITDPLGYLEANCPQINLTKMDNGELAHLFRIAYLQSSSTRAPATMLSAELVNIKGETRLATKVVCPHCGKEVAYGNLPCGSIQVSCRHCMGRFNIPLARLIGRNGLEANTPVLQNGMQHLAQGRIYEAAMVAKGALESHPNDHDAEHLFGLAMLMGGQPDDALTKLQRALQTNPYTASIHINISAAYMSKGYHGWALLHARHALMLDPTSAEARHNADLAYNLALEGDILRFIPAGQPVGFGQWKVVLPDITPPTAIPPRTPLRQGNEAMKAYHVPRLAAE